MENRESHLNPENRDFNLWDEEMVGYLGNDEYFRLLIAFDVLDWEQHHG